MPATNWFCIFDLANRRYKSAVDGSNVSSGSNHMNAPRTHTPVDDRALIEQHLQHLANTAVSGHRSAGRGVVLLTVGSPDIPDCGGLVEYVAEAEARKMLPSRAWPAESAAALRRYDPDKSFLVMFVDSRTGVCRLHTLSKPKAIANC